MATKLKKKSTLLESKSTNKGITPATNKSYASTLLKNQNKKEEKNNNTVQYYLNNPTTNTEKTTPASTGIGTTNNVGTTSTANLFNNTKKPNIDILKGMQDGTINKDNLMSYIVGGNPNEQTSQSIARRTLDSTNRDYVFSDDYKLSQQYLQSDDYRLAQESGYYTRHPQAMTQVGWVERQKALNEGNTELAKQVEEQDKAKRVQNWNDWWNSAEQVKIRQERTDKYNKEQEKQDKEKQKKIEESAKTIQNFLDETREIPDKQPIRNYVGDLIEQGVGDDEISDYIEDTNYIQLFLDDTKNNPQWQNDRDVIIKMINETGFVDLDENKKIADSLRSTGYEPPTGLLGSIGRGIAKTADGLAWGVGEAGKGITNLGSMAYTGGKNLLTGSDDQYYKFSNPYTQLKENIIGGKIDNESHRGDMTLSEVGSNLLSYGAGLTQSAQTVYFPVTNAVFNGASETETGRWLLSQPGAGPVIGAVIGAIATKGAGGVLGTLKGVGVGAGIGSIPTVVDSTVEEIVGDSMSQENKQNLKGLITNGFFTAMGAKETGNNYKPVKYYKNLGKSTVEGVKNLKETVTNKENITNLRNKTAETLSVKPSKKAQEHFVEKYETTIPEFETNYNLHGPDSAKIAKERVTENMTRLDNELGKIDKEFRFEKGREYKDVMGEELIKLEKELLKENDFLNDNNAYGTIKELREKYENNGGKLSLKEWNTFKRIHNDTNVFNWDAMKSTKAKNAKNIQNTLREFIETKASENGLDNVGEINKLTQAYKEYSLVKEKALNKANNEQLFDLGYYDIIATAVEPKILVGKLANRVLSKQREPLSEKISTKSKYNKYDTLDKTNKPKTQKLKTKSKTLKEMIKTTPKTMNRNFFDKDAFLDEESYKEYTEYLDNKYKD